MPVRSTEVFTPGSFPDYTYVERKAARLEQSLGDSLETPGQIVALSGPSKSGKTVLVERVVGKDKLITITGASIKAPEDVWAQVLDQLAVPSTTTSTQTYSGTVGMDATAKGTIGVPLVASVDAAGTLKGGFTGQTAEAATTGRSGLQQVVKELSDRGFVLLLDDFHYMPREVQEQVARSLKEAVRLGLKIVTASVSHRGDDVLRANPELRGRLHTMDLEYWNQTDLEAIGNQGYEALNADIAAQVLTRFAQETAGSPQLMQSLCLQACFHFGLRAKHEGLTPAVINFDAAALTNILEDTSTRTDFRTLLAILDSGPPTRGTKRSVFSFKDGTRGDVYRAVLKAVAADPPQLSFSYEQLLTRINTVCADDGPPGSSVTSTCVHMARLAGEKLPNERPIDWDDSTQVFDLPDPYFMFYLRWSGRLQVEQRAPTNLPPDSEQDPSPSGTEQPEIG